MIMALYVKLDINVAKSFILNSILGMDTNMRHLHY